MSQSTSNNCVQAGLALSTTNIIDQHFILPYSMSEEKLFLSDKVSIQSYTIRSIYSALQTMGSTYGMLVDAFDCEENNFCIEDTLTDQYLSMCVQTK